MVNCNNSEKNEVYNELICYIPIKIIIIRSPESSYSGIFLPNFRKENYIYNKIGLLETRLKLIKLGVATRFLNILPISRFKSTTVQYSRMHVKAVAAFIGLVILLITFLSYPVLGAAITEYQLPGDYRPRGIAVDSNVIWFTEQFNNKLGRLSGSTIQEYKISTGGSEPWDLLIDPDGDVWFTESHAGKIGLFKKPLFYEFDLTLETGAINGGNPTGIAIDQNATRNVWFTEYTGNGIGKIYYDSDAEKWIMVEYAIPTANSGPLDLAVSPVNQHVWFTENFVGQIGCFNPYTLIFKEYPFPPALSGYQPYNIAIDEYGYIWFSLDIDDPNQYDKIARLNPWTTEMIFYDISSLNANPRGLTVDSDKNIWFTERDRGKIGRLNPVTEYITEYPLPESWSRPVEVAVESNSPLTVYFTEWFSNRIGTLNPDTGISYLTVTTITSATTTIESSTTTTTNPATKTVSSSTLSTTAQYTATGTASSTDFIAGISGTTATETVFVMPTSTTVTSTSIEASTSTTETTTTDTSTSFLSTTTTTTTTTESFILSTPIETSATTTTKSAIFTDYVSTTTVLEYAVTDFRFRTTTAQVSTAFSTVFSTITSTTLVTLTTTITIFVTLAAGISSLGLLVAFFSFILLNPLRRGVEKLSLLRRKEMKR